MDALLKPWTMIRRRDQTAAVVAKEPSRISVLWVREGTFVAAVFLILSLFVWYVGGARSLAVLGFAATLLLAVGIVFAANRIKQYNAELNRFIAALGQVGDAVNIASFDLQYDWKQAAQAMLKSYESLLRQLRDRQTALQKFEFSQSFVQASHRRSEAILGNLSEAILLMNAFGELVFANAEAEKLLGFTFDKVRGKSIRQVLLKTPSLVQLIEQLRQSSAGGQRHGAELALEFAGKSLWFQVTVGGVVDRTTEPIGILAVLRDITAQKVAESRSAEFISAVSHEVKAPLASIKAYAEMLADGDADGDSETQRKFLTIIESQTDQMSRLLDAMLDLARIESGVVRPDKKLVSLNEIIENGAKVMASAAADKGIKVEQYLSALYVPVSADQDMLSRVVMNLVSNAIQFTDSGGRIMLRSELQDNEAVFEVQDNGTGIPADELPRLFQKFYRMKETAGAAPGTGLGLSLVQHIVEAVHGGKVEVESEVGRGSTFRVRLPAQRLD